MSQSSEPFGTIAPVRGLYKIGLATANPPVVRPIPRCTVQKWTVQNVDNEADCYRLYVSDGKKSYALRASEDGTSITAFEASPSAMKSHVWFIPRLADESFAILDPKTVKAWRMSETTVELAEPPNEELGLEPFKFTFSFSG